jgi:hypothetical protein
MRRLAILLVAGCTTAPAGPCEDASEHVAACTGEALSYRAESVCDGSRSSALLAMDCSDLSQLATQARNAGWWDDFLCQIDFADRCATTSRRSLVGLVERADGSPAPRVFVRLVSSGNVYSPIAGAWTIAGGAFAVMDLAPQAYRLEIAMSPTGAVLSAHDISADQPFVAVAAPIP